MYNYCRQIKVLHGKNKAETLLQDFVVSTGKCKFRLFFCRTQLLVFQTSVFLRTLCVFRDQLILFGVYCCAFVDLFSQYCCPVNFKTAEKSTPKPFIIGLRAFFFKKQAPRKSNHDGRIRRPGAGQETNGLAQSALSKKASAPFLWKKIGLCSSFFPYQPQGACCRGANVSRWGGTASLEAIRIG